MGTKPKPKPKPKSKPYDKATTKKPTGGKEKPTGKKAAPKPAPKAEANPARHPSAPVIKDPETPMLKAVPIGKAIAKTKTKAKSEDGKPAKARKGQMALDGTGQIEAGSAPSGPNKKVKGPHTHLVIRLDVSPDPKRLICQNVPSLEKWLGEIVNDFSHEGEPAHLGYWQTFDLDLGAGSTRLAWAEVDHKEMTTTAKAPGAKKVKSNALLTLLAQAGTVNIEHTGQEPLIPSEEMGLEKGLKELERNNAASWKRFYEHVRNGDDIRALDELGEIAKTSAATGEFSGVFNLLRAQLHEKRKPD